jgi:hypothetical protein
LPVAVSVISDCAVDLLSISLHTQSRYTTQSRSEHYEFSSLSTYNSKHTVTFCVTVSVTVQDRNGKTENGKTVTVQDRNGKTFTVGSQTAACYCLSRLFTESCYRFCHCYNTVSLLDGPEGPLRSSLKKRRTDARTVLPRGTALHSHSTQHCPRSAWHSPPWHSPRRHCTRGVDHRPSVGGSTLSTVTPRGRRLSSALPCPSQSYIHQLPASNDAHRSRWSGRGSYTL